MDFYFIAENTPQQGKHRIYLIQTTIGDEHKADFNKAGGYLEKMELQIKNNKAKHDEIRKSNDMQGCKYILEDEGQELNISDLLSRNVEIWLMYVHDKLVTGFRGPSKLPNYDSRKQLRVHILGDVIQTVYAFLEEE